MAPAVILYYILKVNARIFLRVVLADTGNSVAIYEQSLASNLLIT